MPNLLTTTEVAARLGCTRETVRTRSKRPGVRVTKLGGRWYFREQDLPILRREGKPGRKARK